MSTIDTFRQIKQKVHKVLPDAEVYLFGSRANNSAHEESDWDILILEPGEVTREERKKVRAVLYDYAIELGSFINTIIVNQQTWRVHPAYYTLRKAIFSNSIIA